MLAVRRIYLYVVAFVSVVLLAHGVSELARELVVAATDAGSTVVSNLRDSVALNGAFATLGLLGWLLHWGMAQRLARRDPEERAATLRRLFLYATLTVAALVAANALQALLETALHAVVTGSFDAERLLSPIPRLTVFAALWTYHRRVAAVDRSAVGEEGGSATLRRWYVYGVAFVGLAVLFTHTRSVLQLAWELAVDSARRSTITNADTISSPAATSLAALALWIIHWRLRAPEEDRRATLRPVYLFLALAIAVAATLYGGWEILFYGLIRLFGVTNPGGVGGPLIRALAPPASLMAVYGVSWHYHRRAIRIQADTQPELPRQRGVRRLYVYLVSLVALATLASGAGGLLWTVADLATNAPHTVSPGAWWREQTSLYVSMVAVALPVWLLHFGPRAISRELQEAGALSRRIYLYVTLLAAALALLGAGVTLVYQLYLLVLGAAVSTTVLTNLARALSVALTAGMVALYHVRALRADLQLAAPALTPSATPAAATLEAALNSPGPMTPFGVLVRRQGTERSHWFENRQEAARHLESEQARGGAEWAVLVTASATDERA